MMHTQTANLNHITMRTKMDLLKYLGNGGSKMAMCPNKFQFIRMCLHSIKKPLKLLISDTKFGVLIPSGNIWMDLRKDRIITGT